MDSYKAFRMKQSKWQPILRSCQCINSIWTFEDDETETILWWTYALVKTWFATHSCICKEIVGVLYLNSLHGRLPCVVDMLHSPSLAVHLHRECCEISNGVHIRGACLKWSIHLQCKNQCKLTSFYSHLKARLQWHISRRCLHKPWIRLSPPPTSPWKVQEVASRQFPQPRGCCPTFYHLSKWLSTPVKIITC